MDNAFHKFPEDQSAPARLFTNWIRAIHAIDATIAEMETLTANDVAQAQKSSEAAGSAGRNEQIVGGSDT
jgi:hypothetical protein